MRNERIKLPEKVSKSIVNLRDIGLSNYQIISYLNKRQPIGRTGIGKDCRTIRDYVKKTDGVYFDCIVDALVLGYVVEESESLTEVTDRIIRLIKDWRSQND